MEITFLGTGTSQGIPVIACHCEVCTSTDQKDKRLRSSILIKEKGKQFVVDTGPDFRQQMLREKVEQLDAVLFTHEHKDHVAGLDDVRAYNFKQRRKMDVYATERVQKALKREYEYIFDNNNYPGIPQIDLHTIDKSVFHADGVAIQPIEVMHYKLPVLGFRVNDFTYITDAKTIEEEEVEKIKGSRVLVLNALRKTEHISHFNLSEAIALAERIQPEALYLTHISHLMGTHAQTTKDLPSNVHIAYDGLKITI
jgi:phosphoribosyl 1,2-cyclic phosphate phosphodiesterase